MIKLAIALASLAVTIATAAPKVNQPADYTVDIYLKLEVSTLAVQLQGARAFAADLLVPAGVRLLWHDGVAPATGPSILQIVIANTPAGYGTAERAQALAVTTPYSTKGARIIVFADRVCEFLRPYGFRSSIVLGHVLAHEVTHGLEGIARHSETGLLKAHWGPREMAAITSDGLPLAGEDLLLIRMNMKAALRESAAAR